MTRGSLFAILAAAILAGTAAPAFAQKYQNLGRGKCVNCHDHDNEKLWSEKKDGPPPNNHLNALKQMESPKSKAFADATGVKDVYDAASSCVRCHATVVKGDVSNGITCESCHGPGSGYLEPHQKKDAYAQAVSLGMNDFVKKSSNWAGACMKCHVMDDARLIAAKHPSGDDFDLGAKFAVVATGHWKSTYDKGPITAAGKTAAAPLIAARGGAKGAPAVAAAPAAPPPAAPAAPVAAAPAPAPPAPAPASPPGGPAGDHGRQTGVTRGTSRCSTTNTGARCARGGGARSWNCGAAVRGTAPGTSGCSASGRAAASDAAARPAVLAGHDREPAGGCTRVRGCGAATRDCAPAITGGGRRRDSGPHDRGDRFAAAPRRSRAGARRPAGTQDAVPRRGRRPVAAAGGSALARHRSARHGSSGR